MNKNKIKLALISLGCPKNSVDSEKIINQLGQVYNLDFTADVHLADLIIINTCGFISPAIEETKETIEEMLAIKRHNADLKVIVFGCAVSRDFKMWEEMFPGIDGLFSLGQEKEIINFIKQIFHFHLKKNKIDHNLRNIGITLPHYAYLKIADGCSRFCSFCTIPKIRGPYKSAVIDDIFQEASSLVKRGVKELILIAQDTTLYGVDCYKENKLLVLLEKLSSIKGLKWIRLLYAYPQYVDDQLIDFMMHSKKIVNYLDLPIQHSHPEILAKMNRKGTFEIFDAIFQKIRKTNRDFCLRTSVITGFPGETDHHHQHLLSYLKEIQFDRFGAFKYYPEKDTKAFNLKPQIEEKIKEQRFVDLMTQQQSIHFAKNKNLVGKTINTIIDRIVAKNIYQGRTYKDAPDIDTIVEINTRKSLKIGAIKQVTITDVLDYDLRGKI